MSDSKELIPVNEIIEPFLLLSKGKLKWKIETLPEEVLQASAESLEGEIKLTDTDKKLRLQLHKQFSEASSNSTTVRISDICEGVCHSNHFLRLIDDPKKLGWLLLPYQHEHIRLAHQVIQAQDAVEEILSIDIYYRDENGTKRVDLKAADLKYKAAKLIYDRKYPQKQVMQYLNEEKPKKIEASNIEEKIKALEEKLGKSGK